MDTDAVIDALEWSAATIAIASITTRIFTDASAACLAFRRASRGAGHDVSTLIRNARIAIARVRVHRIGL